METRVPSPKVKFAADVSHVREVSLLGTADAAYWRQRLEGEGLVPLERDGHAQLLLIAADLKFMGLRFQELSVSVLVRHHEAGNAQEASFLLRAFNSRRLFAFSERFFFSTPYYFGDVGVSAVAPVFMQLCEGGETQFRAEMRTDASAPRQPVRSGEEGWAGIVYLPGAERDKARQGKWFFAEINGETRAYPFLPAQDVLTIEPTREGVLRDLSDSHFAGKEWVVRADARHAKSKTYKRADWVGLS